MTIAFVVFFAMTSGIIYAVFRYKRVNNEMPLQVHGSSVVEFGGVAFAVIILVALFIPSLILVIDLKSKPAEADSDVKIQVIGHQWWWEFQYPNGIKVQAIPPDYNNLQPPVLVVPQGKTVVLTIRSTDVVHSFYAPNLLYKIQAVPGNVNEMHFKAKKIGSYTGQCYQFCGTRHADMRWVLQVMSQADYDKWLSQTKQAQADSAPSNTDLASLALPAPIKGSDQP